MCIWNLHLNCEVYYRTYTSQKRKYNKGKSYKSSRLKTGQKLEIFNAVCGKFIFESPNLHL